LCNSGRAAQSIASLLSTRPLSALTSVSVDHPLAGIGHPWPKLYVHREANHVSCIDQNMIVVPCFFCRPWVASSDVSLVGPQPFSGLRIEPRRANSIDLAHDHSLAKPSLDYYTLAAALAC
jgi:hypothetical protein